MNKRLLAIVLCLILSISMMSVSVSAEYTPPFQVTANAVYMVNLDSGEVLYSKNAETEIYPASTTKVMTAIVALEHIKDLDKETAVAKPYIIEQTYGSTAGYLRNEVATLRDLMNALLIQSANDAASIIADYVGDGSIDYFIEMMNEKAREIGCTKTTFKNPHGLFDEGHVSTAKDMALIFEYAMNMPVFGEIMATTSYMLAETNKREAQALTPTNKMKLKNHSDYYEYLKAGKTGYLPECGRNFVSVAQKDGFTYLCSVMGTSAVDEDGKSLTKNYAFSDTRKLYDWAFSSFDIKTLLESDQPITEVPLILSSDKDYIILKPETDFVALVPNEIDEASIQKKFNKPERVKAPVSTGEVIGTVDLMLAGEVIGTVNLVSTEQARRNEWLYRIYWFKNTAKTKPFKIGTI
ncbi:MAG: D-alanyl-D-alanine carboxypeptidase, partial [Oscillospiraceae bacterium]|nr:D-alanyl-D-alanine carboxypeptidase [Oscillospiraceae bacterium]